MRERKYLTFDMQNKRHIEAFDLFMAQPSKLGSEFVVNCILAAQEENRLEKMMRMVIAQTLKNVNLSTHTPLNTEATLQTTDDVTKLPDVLIDSMDDI